MEKCRARCSFLGYYSEGVCAGLLLRSWIRDGFYKSLRRNPPLSLWQLPPRGNKPVQLCEESVHTSGWVWFRPVPPACRQGAENNGWYNRPWDGEDRNYYRQGRERSWDCGGKKHRTESLEKNPQQDIKRTPHRLRDYRRGRHACRIGLSLWHTGGYGFLHRGSQTAHACLLFIICWYGIRTWSFRNIWFWKGEKQSFYKSYKRCWSCSLWKNDQDRTP